MVDVVSVFFKNGNGAYVTLVRSLTRIESLTDGKPLTLAQQDIGRTV